MRIFKFIGFILLLCIVALTGFIVGLNYGVNNTEIMEKVQISYVNIQTIKEIKNNKLNNAIDLQLQMLDTNIATIDEIDKNGDKILYFPQRGISYVSALRFIKTNSDCQKQYIKNSYEHLKKEIK